METPKKKRYLNDDGLIISASQGRILERRKRIAALYREMLPRYASFKMLYRDIAEIISDELGCCSDSTVLHDIRLMGLNHNTPQTRMAHAATKQKPR